MKKAAICALAAGLFLALMCLPPEAAAQDDFSVSASATPVEVTVGQSLTIELNITNLKNQTYTTSTPVILVIYVYPSSQSVADVSPLSPNTVISSLGPHRSINVTVSFTPTVAESHSLTVKIYSPNAESANFKDSQEVSPIFLAKPKENGQTDGLSMTIIIGVVAAIILVVVIIAVVMSRRKKPVEPIVEKPAEPVVTEPIEQKAEGKFPKDYYKFRREKFSRLKPVGLTRGGSTILGNIKKQEDQESVLEEPVCVTCCPKCGIQMERNWKTCHNCGAKDTIGKARAAMEKLEKLGIKTGNLGEMLQSAESAREVKNYDEAETYAHDVIDRARTQLRKHEEAHRPEESPSYAPGEMATLEGAPPVVVPASGQEEAAKGYSGVEEAARGYKEVSGAKEYKDESKPDKKEPNPCWKCGQGLRPEWKKCPYCNAPQEGICPSCGRGVKLRWNNCPHCRADLTADKPKLACPVCGAELPGEGECQSCRALALKDTTARLVKEVKAKGADVVEAESLIGRGELAIKIKNYEKAVAHFQKAEELAKKAKKEYRTKRLKERLETAETSLKEGSTAGADLALARSTLSEARTALAEDRIDEGLSLVEKVNNMVVEAMEKVPPPRPVTPIPVLVKRPAVVGDVRVKPRCPHCQEQIEENLSVCPFCLSNLKGRCPRCGAVVKPEWKVCPACEAPLK